MSLHPAALRLTGALVLRDGALQQRSVAIQRGLISKGPLPEVDLSGYLILPGIIDLMGAPVGPRAAGGPDLQTALAATDREIAAHGITTACLSQGWSWAGELHSPTFAEAMLAALEAYRPRALTSLQVQLRCETHTVDTADRLLALARRHALASVLFQNTLETRGPEPHQRANTAAQQARSVPRYLCRLAEAFDTLGTVYGSHGDPDGETRETFSMIGAKLCVAPRKRSAAALARAVGDPVALPASALLQPPGLMDTGLAADLVRAGLCDALVSDGTLHGLTAAAFHLSDSGVLDLPRAWALISQRPAEILRLADRGVIDYGRRADLTVINAKTRTVEATICGGRITYLAGEAAQRFLGLHRDIAIAAE